MQIIPETLNISDTFTDTDLNQIQYSKFRINSETDYQDFKSVFLPNKEYTTMTKRLDTEKNNLIDEEKFCREAYQIITKYNEIKMIGYSKILLNNQCIGNGGVVISEMQNEKISCMEIGIHLKPEYCSKKQLSTSNKTISQTVIEDTIQNLKLNIDEIDDNAIVKTCILEKNIRSYKFFKKNKIIDGEPENLNHVNTWKENIKTFLKRL